eukprot:symbB.v1.2.025607.t1/scaffold2446.1/size186988/6
MCSRIDGDATTGGEELTELEVLGISGECMLTLNVSDSMCGRDLWNLILDEVKTKPGVQLVVSHTSRLALNESLKQQGLGGQQAQVSATYIPVNLLAAFRFALGDSVEDEEFSLDGITEVTGVDEETSALLHNLPKSLRTLTFALGFNQRLQKVRLPTGLQTLTLGYDFNQSLSNVTLPASLQTLTFGQCFNQSLDNVTWPAGLQSLTFGEWFDQRLDNVTWPAGLQSLTFGEEFDQSLVNVTWPLGLQSLTFCDRCSYYSKFNPSFDNVTWPAGLQSLTFGYFCNQSLDNMTWPAGLQNLTFGCCFNQSLDNATWPAGLQNLTFGQCFDQNLDNVTWPAGLQSLTFGEWFNQRLDNVTWPANLQSLIFGDYFNQSLDNVTWPAGLQSLTFGRKFEQRLHKGVFLDMDVLNNVETLKQAAEPLQRRTYAGVNMSSDAVFSTDHQVFGNYGSLWSFFALTDNRPCCGTWRWMHANGSTACVGVCASALSLLHLLAEVDTWRSFTFARRFQEMLQLFTATQATTPDGTLGWLWREWAWDEFYRGQIIKMNLRELGDFQAMVNWAWQRLAHAWKEDVTWILAQQTQTQRSCLDVLSRQSHRLEDFFTESWIAPVECQAPDAFPSAFIVAMMMGSKSAIDVGRRDNGTETQRAFGKKNLRLITAKNRVLVDFEQTLEEAEIEDGECLTALVLQPQLAATGTAFALWCHGDNAIVTWGRADSGGNISRVRDQLKGVRQIQATSGAFAAILEDGSVVTWGAEGSGGHSWAVRDQLRGIQQIQANTGAFAAILADGSVVTWGDALHGGDSSAVQDQLRGVQQIQATFYAAFAAILADGSVVTWGLAPLGGDTWAVRGSAQGCTADSSHFGGLCCDFGRRIRRDLGCWGGGGDSSAVRDQLRGVRQIQATSGAFAAILEDGSVVTWGAAGIGGDSSAVRDQLRDVQQIQANNVAFAAILADGSIVTWGDESRGGDSSAVRDQLRGIQQIQANNGAFAAILADGSVVTWGDALHGGDSSAVQDQLKGVQQIQATERAFAAILEDGSVVTWGDANFV